MTAKFGPAGNSDSFRAMGYRKTEQVPEYIRRMGLDAYEYQCAAEGCASLWRQRSSWDSWQHSRG